MINRSVLRMVFNELETCYVGEGERREGLLMANDAGILLFASLNLNTFYIPAIISFVQFMFGVPKPEEDSALQRMLG